MSGTIDVIIPTYNARHLLEKNLPFVTKNTSNLGNIIIIDNGSEDGTVEWLNKNYPKTIIVQNKTNLGYTKPVNQGVSVSDSKYFVLLNNDVQPQANYISKALEYFADPEVFAVTFNERGASWPDMSWEGGKIQYKNGTDKSKPVLSAWASGGSAIYRRSIWNKLGGFDEIYAPFYWEDIDIGYRAWKSGYKIIWEPTAKVVHDHQMTSNKLNQKYVNLIKQRNELLFNWLNISDISLKISHFGFLVTHSLRHLGYSKVVLVSIWRILTHRHLKRNLVISDQNVLLHISKSI